MNFLLAENVPVNMPAPLGFDGWLSFWMCIAIATVNAVAMCFAGYRFLQVLQLSGYRMKGYFAWIKDTKGKSWGGLCMLSVLSSAALLITNVLLSDFFKYKIMTYLGLIFYLIFLIVYIININSLPMKTPLKYTHRLNRLMGVMFVLVFTATFFLTAVSIIYVPYFRYGAVALIPAFLPLIIVLSHYIVLPFELLNNKRFVKKAVKELEQHKDLIKIGITGSFGKTSVKNMLTKMLSEKYSVCTSPHSYNTPLGLSKTILTMLRSDHQVFVAEMGARHVGDIKYLCDMIKPAIGLITGIGNQHLSTFGSIENLKNTKYELANGVGVNGKMYFAGDSEGSVELYSRFSGYKKLASIAKTSADCYATDVEVGSNGSSFVLHIGKEQITCKTTLLGKHNIANILLCASVCSDLGLTLAEIKRGISKLVPTAHRLALMPSSMGSLTVIDDAYNGNVAGSKAALEVLSLFSGKKYVITPGLVELGKESFNSNFQFGIDMAKVCDKVIINGVSNFEAIEAGLLFGGFKKENIYRAGSLKQATEVLNTFASPDDVVLFENDLPDNYM